MADELKTVAPIAATTQTATPAPVEITAPIAQAPVATVTDVAPPIAAPVAEPIADAPKVAETVLGAEPPKVIEPVKAPDATVEIKKEDAPQSAEPAQLPTYEAFKLPEGISFEDKTLSEFTKELAEFQTKTKAEQAFVQEFGQKLVDRHIAEVQNTVKRLNEHYTSAWEKQKIEWKDNFVKDPEIGGNRQETTVSAALQFIRTHGGTESQQQEFRQLMETTGIGNHPAMIRLLAKANMNMAEGKPLPATTPMPQAKSKVATRYGQSN